MIRNYIKIAIRNLIKLKGFTLLNIFGLAIGIAASILILQFLRSEISVDKHHAQLSQLYHVNTAFTVGGKETTTATSPSPLAWTLVNDYPEVEQAARLLKAPGVNQNLIKYKQKFWYWIHETLIRTDYSTK